MQIEPIFRDRTDAGRTLAKRVLTSVQDPDSLVLALPRGGVPVGFELARALRAELGVFLVRKLGFPGHEELAIGAIASGRVRVLNEELIKELGLPFTLINRVTTREKRELTRREELVGDLAISRMDEKDPAAKVLTGISEECRIHQCDRCPGMFSPNGNGRASVLHACLP